jgi:hypothetical protein
MNEVVCPHCKKAFKVDEAGFADILKQVRDHEFEQELLERVKLLESDKESAVKLAEAHVKNELQTQISAKETEIAKIKADQTLTVTELKAKLESAAIEKQLAVTQAVNVVERERNDLANKLENKDAEQRLLESSLKDK